jgi:hypothetical protein
MNGAEGRRSFDSGGYAASAQDDMEREKRFRGC